MFDDHQYYRTGALGISGRRTTGALPDMVTNIHLNSGKRPTTQKMLIMSRRSRKLPAARRTLIPKRIEQSYRKIPKTEFGKLTYPSSKVRAALES